MSPPDEQAQLQDTLTAILLEGRELKDVAAKSKLLAFNAAIVAAQAGEHGRSFAVVAEQMKALNNRAHKAANALVEQGLVLQAALERLTLPAQAALGARANPGDEASAR